VFARITTFYTADPSSYSDLELRRLLLASNQEVLRQMDGLKNIYIFKSVDRQSGKALVITLWESEEAMHRSEEAVRTLRKETAGALAANIVAVEHYEVWEILEQERRERVEHELRVARTIQQASLPKEVPELEGWKISPYYRPAREVGGDFYDFHLLPGGRLGLVVGDATGKGVPAALVMSTTCGMLQLAAQALDSSSPGEVLRQVNEALVARIPQNMFVTCFYAVLEPKSASLSYANAGHDLPYLQRRGKAEELRARGMPLGLMPGMGYEEKEMVLDSGEVALFYSDGLVEAHDPEGEMFGFPKLRALIAEHAEEERSLGEFLMEELYTFVGEGWEQEDNITILALKRSASLS
jgi:serine phosphatase RsbU (regulator of sigma subunit)